MSLYALNQQTMHAILLKHYCDPCQKAAVVLALDDVMSTSPARAFALVGITVNMLEDGAVQPCNNVCLNSRDVTKFYNANDDKRVAMQKAEDLGENLVNYRFQEKQMPPLEEYGPYAGV